MSNPQGPDRYREDPAEQTGELPAWGQQPPGGWGDPDGAPSPGPDRRPAPDWADQGAVDAGWDPDTARRDPGRDSGWGGPDPAATGGWDPQATGGWGPGPAGGWPDGGAAGDTTRPAPLWGDDAAGQDDGWAVPTGRRGRRRAAEPDAPVDAVPGGSPSSGWGAEPAAPGEGAWGAAGDEPWSPRENVRSPRTGPFGLGLAVWGAIAAAVVLLAVVLVTAFLVPGWAVTRNLDQTALQNGVTQVLTQDYGLGVGAVQCPDDVAVSTGTEFSCQAVVDGEQVEVPGTVTSDEGDYQVGRV